MHTARPSDAAVTRTLPAAAKPAGSKDGHLIARAKSVAVAKTIRVQGKGQLLMKDSLHTDELGHAVTASGAGLRTAQCISHVFIMDVSIYAETVLITDTAINVFPDLDAKRDVVQSAGIVFGACVRIILTSRADSVLSRMASQAVAVLYAAARRRAAALPAA